MKELMERTNEIIIMAAVSFVMAIIIMIAMDMHIVLTAIIFVVPLSIALFTKNDADVYVEIEEEA